MRQRLAWSGSRSGTIAAAVLVALITGPRAATAQSMSRDAALPPDRVMDAIGIKAGMTVGEAGAGHGYFTFNLARRVGPTGAVYANDIDEHGLADIEQRAKREGVTCLHVVRGEIDDPLFPRHDLDSVVMVYALHDFAHPAGWLGNLKKYLKPGGTVALVEADRAKTGSRHFWTREAFIRCAAEAGYELVKIVDDFPEHMVILFQPKAA